MVSKIAAPSLNKWTLELLDEKLAYWYPSQEAFLSMISSPHRIDNFELRKKLIVITVIHRCDGRNVFKLNKLR